MSCVAIIYIKDACCLARGMGLPSLIYHEPVLEVRFMRGAAGTTRILTIRGRDSGSRVAISHLTYIKDACGGPSKGPTEPDLS